MKRSEFVDLVNEVAEEERIALQEKVKEIRESHDENVLADLLAGALVQIAEASTRTAAKIIEKLGLVQFDD